MLFKFINYCSPYTEKLIVELESGVCAASVATGKDVVGEGNNSNVSIDQQLGGDDFVIGEWD